MGLEPEYVLDRMEMYEVRALLSNFHMKNQEDWERTRFLGYLMAKCAGSKINSVTDFMKLPWDKEGREHESQTISKEDVKRLHDMATAVAEFLKVSSVPS